MFQDLKRDNGSGPPTRDWSNRLLDRLESLVVSAGPGLRMQRGPSGTILTAQKQHQYGRDGGRYTVTFNSSVQKLHVGEGSVAWSNTAQPDSVARPFIPKLDGVSLSQNPGWSVAGKSTGTEYEVLCIYSSSTARMVLHEKDGEEELEMEDNERARLIASVTFAAAETGLKIHTLDQRWQDDIEHIGADDGSSGASGDSGDSDGDGVSDDDSDGSGPDFSDSDDSDGSSSSSSGSCCPGVTIQDALVMAIGPAATLPPEDWPVPMAVCYGGIGMPEDTLVYVISRVGALPPSCTAYRGRLWLVVTVGGVRKTRYLGLAIEGDYLTEHVITGTAGADFEVEACVEMFGTPVPGGLDPLTGCCDTYELILPGACGDEGGSGDSDSEDSSDSGGSSDCELEVVGQAITGLKAGWFRVKNNGTSTVEMIIDDIESSITLWELPSAYIFYIAPGEELLVEMEAQAEDVGGSMSGTVVHLTYNCSNPLDPTPLTVTF